MKLLFICSSSIFFEKETHSLDCSHHCDHFIAMTHQSVTLRGRQRTTPSVSAEGFLVGEDTRVRFYFDLKM